MTREKLLLEVRSLGVIGPRITSLNLSPAKLQILRKGKLKTSRPKKMLK